MDEKLLPIFQGKSFLKWSCLNDTIMGGSSYSSIENASEGVLFKGFLVSEKGGFISCRSPLISPALDLSNYDGIELSLDTRSRVIKFAISCEDSISIVSGLISSGLKWVTEIKTNLDDITVIRIPFDNFEPSIRAQPVNFPIGFSQSKINRFQLLYSKFNSSGGLNDKFYPGRFNLKLISIKAFK